MFCCFKKKKVKHETPKDVSDRIKDTKNDGSTKSPDWSYIADNIKLDKESSKRSTLNYYYLQYLKVENEIKLAAKLSNAPFWFIAGIDMREMSFIHTGHFANGEKIIGTGKKTSKLWPYGLGPADTWSDSVLQALDYERNHSSKFKQLVNKDMDFGQALEASEIYNGHGFRTKGVYSEYNVGFTNFSEELGRYVADGRYNPNARVTRPGVAAFVLYLLGKGKLKESDLYK